MEIGEIEIKEGTIQEIEHFQLWHPDNEGDTITVLVDDENNIIAFAQHTGSTIYHLEAKTPGMGHGRMLLELILEHHDYAIADNVMPGTEGFWRSMGFEFENNKWDWYAE